jgi:hypothetical protein
MCCSLCEEPVRSALFGLAAVGAVAIVRTAQKALKDSKSAEQAPDESAAVTGETPADGVS